MSETGAVFLAVCIENAELREQLAKAQDQCVELAVEVGKVHAENVALRVQLVEAKRDLRQRE